MSYFFDGTRSVSDSWNRPSPYLGRFWWTESKFWFSSYCCLNGVTVTYVIQNGESLRVVAVDEQAATMGIWRRSISFAFALGSARRYCWCLLGCATTPISTTMGITVGLKAFRSAVLKISNDLLYAVGVPHRSIRNNGKLRLPHHTVTGVVYLYYSLFNRVISWIVL